MRRFCLARDLCPVVLAICTLFFVGANAGCSRTPKEPAKVKVEGKVLHDNHGVPWVLVFFYGQDGARVAEAATDNDGSFSLTCPPGNYRVALRAVPAGAGQSPGGGAADAGSLIQAPDQKGLKQIPKSYLNAATSGWTVDIPEGGRDDIKLNVK